MTSSIANAEELFRFASTRAPSPAPRQNGLLELADESQVAAWLAEADQQDAGAQIEALDSAWNTLTKRGADSIAADLRAASLNSVPVAPTDLFPAMPGPEDAKGLQDLLTSLWKFYLQAIATGKATMDQLLRAQQLMGQVKLLLYLVSGPAATDGAIAPETLAGAAAPLVRLPAAFEEHLRAKRDAAAAAKASETEQARVEQADALNVLVHTLDTLGALEKRLVAALEETPAAPEPIAPAGMFGLEPKAEKLYRFQSAADTALAFRQQNDALLQQLAEAGVATASLNPFQLLDAVRRRISTAVLTASSAHPALLPAGHPLLGRVAGHQAPAGPALPAGGQFGIRALGVADLRVVRQVLVKYDKGELAHIENVLQGEERERYYSRLQRVDQGEYSWAESETEVTRDTASTERFEVGQYAFDYLREQRDSSTGINISATYGDVNVNTSSYQNTSRSEEHSRGSDLRLSFEVVSRAVNTLRERVGRQRYLNRTSEIQESTVHRQRAEEANVIGQYRWVDKVYQAQVYNYGARAMYEIMVPKPAAMFAYLLAQQPGHDGHAGPAPVRPDLSPADITDATWALYAQRYGVTLPAPPAAAITEFAQASYPAKSGSKAVAGGVFNAPEALRQGYVAASAGCSMAWYGVSGQCGVTASIGTRLFISNEDGAAIPSQPIGAETGEVNYSASGWGALDQFTVNLYLVWTRSQRALEQWQLACYQAIMDAYEQDLAKHRERLAAARENGAGPHAPLSTARMRGIERTELKRAVLEIVRGSSGTAAPAPAIVTDGVPKIQTAQLEQAAKEVRFFETAFEWEQMTYRFHPYFWTETAPGWSAATFDQQGDSVFTAFLNAGFATVVLPVRQGFEDAAALYLQTGLVLDLPVAPADDALASLNRDVQWRNQVIPAQGIAEGDPWTYRVPTTLVVLDDGTRGPLPDSASGTLSLN